MYRVPSSSSQHQDEAHTGSQLGKTTLLGPCRPTLSQTNYDQSHCLSFGPAPLRGTLWNPPLTGCFWSLVPGRGWLWQLGPHENRPLAASMARWLAQFPGARFTWGKILLYSRRCLSITMGPIPAKGRIPAIDGLGEYRKCLCKGSLEKT